MAAADMQLHVIHVRLRITVAAESTESAIRERKKQLGMLPGQVKVSSIWLQIRLVKVMAGFHTITIGIVYSPRTKQRRGR